MIYHLLCMCLCIAIPKPCVRRFRLATGFFVFEKQNKSFCDVNFDLSLLIFSVFTYFLKTPDRCGTQSCTDKWSNFL